MEVLEKSEIKVRKSNVFVEGRYKFGVNDQKILLTIISCVKMDEKEFQPYRVSWLEIKKITGGQINTAAKLYGVCEALKNKTITIKKGLLEDSFGFLSGWIISPGEYAEFRIDPSMKEMLLDLLGSGRFTLYDLECVLALKSSYSVRIYEILKSLAWKGQPVDLALDDFKWSLDIDPDGSSYDDFGNFRRFILDRAKKDLELHTDIKFEYKAVKGGRRVKFLTFHIQANPRYQKTVQGAINKKSIIKAKKGDIVIINGEECEVLDGGCYYTKKGKRACLNHGALNELLKQGKAKLKNK